MLVITKSYKRKNNWDYFVVLIKVKQFVIIIYQLTFESKGFKALNWLLLMQFIGLRVRVLIPYTDFLSCAISNQTVSLFLANYLSLVRLN